jgi:predicted Zn-dependent protease
LTQASSLDFTLIRIASLLESDPAAAAREATRILRAHPGNMAATLLLGTAHRACAAPQAAVAAFTQLAAAQPDSAVIQLELGRALLAQGQHSEAAVVLERAVKLAPDLAPAWRELSMLHAARSDTAACDAAYARFHSLTPEGTQLAEAATAIAAEQYSAAENLLNRTLARAPHEVAALRLLAEVAAGREDYPRAERLLAECLRLAPGYSRAREDLVLALQRQLKGEPMLPLLERLLAFDPGNLRYRVLQADAYNLIGRTERASELLQGLAGEVPDNEHVWLHYGHTLRTGGRRAEAIAAYRRCTAIKPGFGAAWFSLANLKTFHFDAGDIATMQAQLARQDLRHEDRVHFEFALGEALEDSGDFAASFAHYAQGNALRRAVIQYQQADTSALVERTQALYTPQFFAARAGCGSSAPDPIFIVGMPRAGSTLIEQILASHSQVEGTRELTDVIGFTLELGAREEPGKPSTYPLPVARLSAAELTALGERYLAQTRPHRGLGRARFIDKMGGNFMNVGLIHLMLPNARIIDARRSALGCCFSNFKQYFHRGLLYSYSLEDLGHYYREYVRVMAHYEAVLPGRVHRISYEDLVANLETEVRRLLEFCGLPFEEQCLRFHETRRNVQTVSSEQVRQPLYTDGLEQWRKFEPWLDPLKQALGELVVAQSPRAASSG